MNIQKIYIHILLLLMSTTICSKRNTITKEIAYKAFGGWSIDTKLFNFIREILPEGSVIVELGSGWASGELSKLYTVYSIEHSKRWLGRYNTNYIFAPIKDRWYDIAVLQKELPKEYDLILVDGPPETIGRGGFFTNLDLFNTNVPIVFDDVNRHNDYINMERVAEKLGREYKVYQSGQKKQFGVIMPE